MRDNNQREALRLGCETFTVHIVAFWKSELKYHQAVSAVTAGRGPAVRRYR